MAEDGECLIHQASIKVLRQNEDGSFLTLHRRPIYPKIQISALISFPNVHQCRLPTMRHLMQSPIRWTQLSVILWNHQGALNARAAACELYVVRTLHKLVSRKV